MLTKYSQIKDITGVYLACELVVMVSLAGNASPRAIRSVSYVVPCEGQMVLLSRLPLGALVTPLLKQNAGEVRF